MKIHRINPLTKLPIIVDLDVTEKQIKEHFNGKLIQSVWPNMSSDEREFYLSGVPMGLYEIQFEKRFVEILNIDEFRFRFELYFAKSLLSLDKSKLNIFCYFYLDNELIKFERINFKINDNKFQLFGDLEEKFEIKNISFEIQNLLNTNQKLIDFCIEQNVLIEKKYSFNDIVKVLNQFEYDIPNKISDNKQWLKDNINLILEN